MAEGLKTPALTMLEWSPADHRVGERIARKLGYQQYAYTSTSALWGLFCLPENPATAKRGEAIRHACIIKTPELGFMVVYGMEDLGLDGHGHGRPEVMPAVQL